MSKYPNYGKKTYSEAEKRAYHGGRAYAVGKAGKRVKLKTEKERKSFSNGVKSIRVAK